VSGTPYFKISGY